MCTTTGPFGDRTVTPSALTAIFAKGEPAGNTVTIHAKFVSHDRFTGEPGEPLSPVVTPNNIIISENRARLPHFTTYTTPILVAASTNNKPYRLPLSHPEQGTYLEITVSPANTP